MIAGRGMPRLAVAAALDISYMTSFPTIATSGLDWTKSRGEIWGRGTHLPQNRNSPRRRDMPITPGYPRRDVGCVSRGRDVGGNGDLQGSRECRSMIVDLCYGVDSSNPWLVAIHSVGLATPAM